MKKTVVLIVCTCIIHFSFAQKQGQELIDSLTTVLSKANEDTGHVDILNLLGKTYIGANENKKAMECFNNALTLSRKLNYKRGEGNALHNLAYDYAISGEVPLAVKYYEESIKIRKEIGDQKGLAATYNNMGLVLQNQGNYAESLKMFYASLKINEGLGDKIKISSIYNNIGILYWTQKQYSEALAIYKKALGLMGPSEDSSNLNHPYNNMAGIYADMGNYEESLRCYFITLRIREQMGDKNLIADAYTGIGIVYQKTNKYEEAVSQFKKALDLYTQIGNDFGVAGMYASFGEIAMAQKKFTEARTFFNKAMEIYKKTGDPFSYYYIFEDLAKTDSAAGNHKSAFENYKAFVLYRDSSVNQENNKKLVQSQMQYDFDKKEALTKAEQEKKDAIAERELEKQKLVRNGFVGGFAVVLLFAGVFFTQRNKIKKGKQRSDELLLNILPAETAEELKLNGSAEAKSYDEVTVMFTDFKNFTQASEKLPAAELVKQIHTCYSAFDRIIEKHNLEKIKTIGDSYMCAGGLPVSNKTHAYDVVNAALEMQEYMNQLEKDNLPPDLTRDASWQLRIGIHTGPVVAGIVGIKKFAYDIWGDTVNIASRMESSGEEGKVNISGATYNHVKDKFNCIHRGKILAKNKGEIDMYFVEG